jgi:uncharacterized protein (TIGR00730 family)
MPELTAVCVFCGSSTGDESVFHDAAAALGRLLADRGITLVYGGGSVGLMGVLADAALARGGEVVGVLPRDLFVRESVHRGLTELVEVDSMHERKRRMYERADAFIALPGGLGTLEELAEIATWAQLGLHTEPIGILEVAGYFAPLIAFLDGAVEHGFLRPETRAVITHDEDPQRLLDRLARAEPAPTGRWITSLDET